jgi:hypothetical protein
MIKMVKEFHKGDIYGANTYRTWLINFHTSHGKFLVFGSPDDAKEAVVKLKKGLMKDYPYKPSVKEITGKLS